MRRVYASIAVLAVIAVSGCDADEPDIMPNVVGQTLDVALTDIRGAGILAEPEVEGGGLFGIIDEENWVVCSQDPAGGQEVDGATQLVVDRDCEPDVEATAPATPEPSETPEESAEASPEPTATEEAPEAAGVLTVDNNADLAELLTSPDDDALGAAFAANYLGSTIQFDGYISALAPFEDYDTRFNLIIDHGDGFDDEHVTGPGFRYINVTMSYDMNFVGDNVPDYISVGQKVTATMVLQEWDSDLGMFVADPVETSIRD